MPHTVERLAQTSRIALGREQRESHIVHKPSAGILYSKRLSPHLHDPQPVAIVPAFYHRAASSNRPIACASMCYEPHLLSTVLIYCPLSLVVCFVVVFNNSLRRHGVSRHGASILACLFRSTWPGTWFHPFTAKLQNRSRARRGERVGHLSDVRRM
jgi:hypothetical protein